MVIGRPKPDGTPYTNTDDGLAVAVGERGQGRPVARLHPVRPDHRPAQRRAGDPRVQPPEPGRVPVHRAQHRDPRRHRARSLRLGLPRRPAVPPGDDRREVLARRRASARSPRLRGRPVPADRRDERHADLPHRRGRRTADGRPMVVLYFADCDPAGWQMILSVSPQAAGAQACCCPECPTSSPPGRAHPGPGRRVRLAVNPAEGHRAAGRQVAAGDGRRADRDRRVRRCGPDLLRQIAREALDGFFDHTLCRRVAALPQ